jgi:hypothetical protein
MARDMKFDAHFGDEIKKVVLSQPFGTGSGYWHVYVDDYYQGRIVQENGEY